MAQEVAPAEFRVTVDSRTPIVVIAPREWPAAAILVGSIT